MDQILNKVGSYWFSNKANKEISSVGDDINSLSTSIEGGAKWFVNKLKVSLPISVNSHVASVSLLNGTNFAEWKEQVEFNLSVLDLDLALLVEKPVALTNESSADDVSFHQAWERSNRLSIRFLRMTIANNIKTTLPQTDNAKEYMENIADRFRTANKSLAGKLMSDLTSMCFDGKMQKALQELLKEYDMPVGIFPRDATNYEFNEETGKLTVFIPSICEVGYKDSSVLRFFTTVTGYLEKGKLADIEGMKTKVMVWVKVTSITTQGPKVHFSTGLKKTRSREAYEVLRDGFIIDKF